LFFGFFDVLEKSPQERVVVIAIAAAAVVTAKTKQEREKKIDQ